MQGIPTTDTWTFTAFGAPWTDQQWGAQVILAAVYQVGSWTGLVLFRAALTGVIFGSLFLIGRRRGLVARDAALLAFAAFLVAAVALALRPQLIGMALFAIVLVLVTDRRAHPGRLWAIPFIVLAWANIHGSFFLGPVVLGLAWLEDLHDHVPQPHRALRRWRVVSVGGGLRDAVRSGRLGVRPGPLDQPLRHRAHHRMAGHLAPRRARAAVLRRRRWRSSCSSPGAARRTAWPTLAWLGRLLRHRRVRHPRRRLVAARGRRRDRRRPRSPAGSPIPPRPEPLGHAADAPAQRGGRRGHRRSPVSSCCRSGARPSPGSRRPAASSGWHRPASPVRSGTMAAPGDHVFNPQPWGSWFEFALPDLPVGIDSRIELFPASVWDAYEDVIAGVDGWQAQLDDLGRGVRRRRQARGGLRRAAGGRRLAPGLRRRRRLALRDPEPVGVKALFRQR